MTKTEGQDFEKPEKEIPYNFLGSKIPDFKRDPLIKIAGWVESLGFLPSFAKESIQKLISQEEGKKKRD